MAVQFEDVVDCCVALYGDVYDFLFLFDHSCGHDRKAAGALDAKALNVGYGGSQPHMSPSEIVAVHGFLGEHARTLNVGNFQSFQFSDDNSGPFYLTEADRAQKKENTETGRLLRRKKTKKELSNELLEGRHVDVRLIPSTLKGLQEKATQFNIELEIEVELIEEGWVGKPKGLGQIAWERGLLDPAVTLVSTRFREEQLQ